MFDLFTGPSALLYRIQVNPAEELDCDFRGIQDGICKLVLYKGQNVTVKQEFGLTETHNGIKIIGRLRDDRNRIPIYVKIVDTGSNYCDGIFKEIRGLKPHLEKKTCPLYNNEDYVSSYTFFMDKKYPQVSNQYKTN